MSGYRLYFLLTLPLMLFVILSGCKTSKNINAINSNSAKSQEKPSEKLEPKEMVIRAYQKLKEHKTYFTGRRQETENGTPTEDGTYMYEESPDKFWINAKGHEFEGGTIVLGDQAYLQDKMTNSWTRIPDIKNLRQENLLASGALRDTFLNKKINLADLTDFVFVGEVKMGEKKVLTYQYSNNYEVPSVDKIWISMETGLPIMVEQKIRNKGIVRTMFDYEKKFNLVPPFEQ